MLKPERRAGLSAAARLVVISATAGLIAGAVLVPVVGAIGVAARNAAKTFNDLSVQALGQVPTRSRILDSKGHLIAYFYPNGIYRVPVAYNQIAPVMRKAIIAIEDSRFYLHGALDFKGSVRALANNLGGSAVQGGSTLAQQYVKNACILTAHSQQEATDCAAPSPARKIRELRTAAIVEQELTKDQLLAAYLNVAYFENSAYGIQVAAERYFSTSASRLTLAQAAMLAGMVENPFKDNPIAFPTNALARRTTVLQRMRQLRYITGAQATAAEKAPLGLNMSTIPLQTGCTASSAQDAAFFCDYVLAVIKTDPTYAKTWSALNTTGGLTIYTTMDPQDQRAAEHAVTYMVPPPPSSFNLARNAAAEVLIQPRSGYVRAIAVDRPYGNGRGQDNVDYAVDSQYNGGVGVQTGSSSKLFTLLTALKQGYQFGFNLKITSPATISGYTSCNHSFINPYQVSNAEGPAKPAIYTLYNGTTGSINVFYATLEQKVGLCNVVKTAASLGVHRANGKSLFQGVGNPRKANYQPPADALASFTLGSVNVSPMTMAAAYATLPARGIYCNPIAIAKIVTSSGAPLPVESARCHRVISQEVADAANYILQGVITGGTGSIDGFTRNGVFLPQAGKTGTANNFQYVAFAGYTPRLAGYVSMFNPADPVTHPMKNVPGSCYRLATGAPTCALEMFGANAGQIWQFTFEHANLGSPTAYFVSVPADSWFLKLGNGVTSPKPPKPPKHHGGGGGGGPGGGGGGPGGGNGGGNGGGGGGTGGPGPPNGTG